MSQTFNSTGVLTPTMTNLTAIDTPAYSQLLSSLRCNVTMKAAHQHFECMRYKHPKEKRISVGGTAAYLIVTSHEGRVENQPKVDCRDSFACKYVSNS